MIKYCSAEEAVKVVESNNIVYLQAAAAAPTLLANALTERAAELKNVEICHLHTEGEARYANPELSESFHVNSFFIGKNVRHTISAGNGSYTPVFLSELPMLFKKRIINLDVVFIHVSAPDAHGYCSLGTSVEATVAAIDNAKIVVAQINPRMPRTFGDSVLHISEINYGVEIDMPIHGHEMGIISPIENKIGQYVASLIDDRSTLQMGIGSIPNAALANLTNHKDLGLHTEMFSDGVIDLIESGVINCKYKGINRGQALATFLVGSQRLYDFVDNNPGVAMLDVAYTNRVSVIAQNPKNSQLRKQIKVIETPTNPTDMSRFRMWHYLPGRRLRLYPT